MKFKRGNKIRYGQDFGIYQGVPANIDFEVELLDKDGDSVKLVAPGYGGEPYGNGALYIYRSWSIPKTEKS